MFLIRDWNLSLMELYTEHSDTKVRLNFDYVVRSKNGVIFLSLEIGIVDRHLVLVASL